MDIYLDFDNRGEGKAALQDLLRLASANLADAHQEPEPGSLTLMETEVTAIINEWTVDPERFWSRVAWFGKIAGATAVLAARRLEPDDEPTDAEVMDALRNLERAIEELLSS